MLVAASVLEIATAIGALGVAGLIGAWIQADRERQERMRERMIAAADDFLADAYAAYLAAERIVVGDDSELESRLPETLELMYGVDARVPRLALMFPSEGGGFGTVVQSALKVTDGFREAAAGVLERVEMKNPTVEQRSEAFGPISANLGLLMGDFSLVANQQIWKGRLRPKRARSRDSSGSGA